MTQLRTRLRGTSAIHIPLSRSTNAETRGSRVSQSSVPSVDPASWHDVLHVHALIGDRRNTEGQPRRRIEARSDDRKAHRSRVVHGFALSVTSQASVRARLLSKGRSRRRKGPEPDISARSLVRTPDGIGTLPGGSSPGRLLTARAILSGSVADGPPGRNPHKSRQIDG